MKEKTLSISKAISNICVYSIFIFLMVTLFNASAAYAVRSDSDKQQAADIGTTSINEDIIGQAGSVLTANTTSNESSFEKAVGISESADAGLDIESERAEIPEFGTITALLALIGTVIFVVVRKKRE